MLDLDRTVEKILDYAADHLALTMLVIVGIVFLLILYIRGQE